jgi:hypothetical protein
MQIDVYFKNYKPLHILVDNTATGRIYYDLVKEHYAKEKPFYQDNIKWTPEYLVELAKIAKQKLGWDWLADEYSLDLTAKLHKDLEYSVGRVGFENMPEEYDWLLYDMHHCLHSIQYGKTEAARTCNFQIEWLTDDGAPLPDDFEFQQQANTGDVILINPYVGHNPLQLYMENDFDDLDSTCKFHDKVKPAIVIVPIGMEVDRDAILQKFISKDPEFVERVTPETILRYTGVARIGAVTNVEDFRTLLATNEELEFDRLEFIDG